VLNYPDPGAAAEWLSKAFGFAVRLRIGNHRVQMKAGDGCFTIAEGSVMPNNSHIVQVRIEDAEGHCKRARQNGAFSRAIRRWRCRRQVRLERLGSLVKGHDERNHQGLHNRLISGSPVTQMTRRVVVRGSAGCSTSMSGRRDRQVGPETEHYGVV
jgi:hypothetical protein